MKEKFLPWFMLFCALGLSGTAAYYSVLGLSIVFSGVAIPVIIMGSFLEISKIGIATYLHDKWKETYGALKIYMTIALITLSVITSLGIYGLLSTGFQQNIAKLEISDKQVKNVEVKKKRFEEIKIELTKEKTTLDGDITKLRDGLSTNTTTQTVDRKTGQLITRANNENRKSFENQLKGAQVRRDTLSKRIDSMNDSITKLDVDILNMESKEIEGSELGAIKYLSEVLDWDIKRTANFFILILIFVFDPLAITLVIATNQAFKNTRKNEDTPQVPHNQPPTNPQDTIQDTIQDTDQVPTKYRPSTDQVETDKVKEDDIKLNPTEELIEYLEKVLEENYKTSENINEEPIKPTEEDLLKLESFLLEKEEEVKKEDDIIEETPTEILEKPKPKKLSYLNRDGYGKSLRIDRI